VATSNAQSRNLLRELATITRDVYNALNSVSAELPLDRLTESSGGITEAVQRLNSVVSRLDDAATQNLDHLERVNLIAMTEEGKLDGVVESLRSAQKRLTQIKEEHPDLEGALTALQDRLSDEVGAPAMTLRHHMSRAGEQHLELISNQSFQELTGRTLKKIIEFVQTIEADLYDILRQFRPGSVPERTRPVSEAGPNEGGGSTQSQEDVDKLLEDLGF